MAAVDAPGAAPYRAKVAMATITPKTPTELRASTEPSARMSRVTSVASLDELVGAHPDSLRALFTRGAVTDPSELGDAPRGRLLGLAPLAGVHLATRPLVRAIAGTPLWTGVGFDHGGNAGFNRVLGAESLRFRTSVQDGELDGRPALVLTYDRSPWPFSLLRDELRTVAPGLAIGAFFARAGGGHTLLGWFGLSSPRA